MIKKCLLWGVLTTYAGPCLCDVRFPEMQDVQTVKLQTRNRVVTDTNIGFKMTPTLYSVAAYGMAGCNATPGTVTTRAWTSLVDKNATGFSVNSYINKDNWAWEPTLVGEKTSYRVVGTWETPCANPVMWIGWWNGSAAAGSYIKWGNTTMKNTPFVAESYIALPAQIVQGNAITAEYPSQIRLVGAESAQLLRIRGGDTVVSIGATGEIAKHLKLYSRNGEVALSSVLYLGDSTNTNEIWVTGDGEKIGTLAGTVTLNVGTI